MCVCVCRGGGGGVLAQCHALCVLVLQLLSFPFLFPVRCTLFNSIVTTSSWSNYYFESPTVYYITMFHCFVVLYAENCHEGCD